MKIYRFKLYAHQEVDIEADSMKEAKRKVEEEWLKLYGTSLVWYLDFIELVEEKK